MTTQSTGAPFAHAARGVRGYDAQAVDAFLERARVSFQGGGGLTSDDVRKASFPLVRGGFDVPSVDAALARLEDAMAARERDARIRETGAGAWVAGAKSEAQELLGRMSRPEGHRFDRVAWHRSGYSVVEVDIVATRISRYFAAGEPITADQVRSAAFHPQRGGYREEQVDAALDAAVRVILAVR
ncbi:MAG: DivIVA domain-containing protein [Microbacterium gubbeenense]